MPQYSLPNFRRKVFSKGNIYDGEWNDKDQFHGQGQFYWFDFSDLHGVRFLGEYKYGLRDGHGRIEYPDGYVFEGEYKADKANGYGKEVYSNGVSYEGEFRDDMANGSGRIVYENGDDYVGMFCDYVKHGRGTFHWAKTGNRFIGEYREGVRCGSGIYYYANGDRFEGEYKDDIPNGHGTYFYSNDYSGDDDYGYDDMRLVREEERFECTFRNGKRHGVGRYHFANGNRLEADWRDDAPVGNTCKFYWHNGNTYDGEWWRTSLDSHQLGKEFCANGDRYTGEFKKFVRNGQGTCYYANGDLYEGEWQNGRKHGQGRYYCALGDRWFETQWHENILVSYEDC